VVDLGRKGHASPSLIDRDLEVLALTPKHAHIQVQQAGTFELMTARGRSVTFEIPEPLVDVIPAGPWKLEFPEGHGAPATLELDELKSWTELETKGARVFSGTARYTTTMYLPDAYMDTGHVLQLDLGQVAEVAEVSVNGTSIGILWNPPFRADVTGLLKAGANHLEVKVTNVWHNRIVGDLRYPETGIHARTNLKHKFSADMELLPSGLLGPVVLRSIIEVDIPV
jgi:hypothetical protein